MDAKAKNKETRSTTHRAERTFVRDGIQAYLKTIRNHSVLTKEEEYKLAHQFRDSGDEDVLLKLVNSNLRLVVKIAYEYRTAQSNVLDLIQEGNLGLLCAVRKFDPERNVRLSSYAQWWIRAYILKYLMDNHRLVKIGTTQSQRKLYYNLNKAREQLRQQGTEPTTQALASYLNVKERDVIEMELRLNQYDLRLNAPVDDDTATEHGDLIPSDVPLPEDVVSDREFWGLFKRKLQVFQEGLEGRDVMIWQKRLVSDEPLTLRELAGEFGVSRERVRQLEARIVRKLTDYMHEELDPSLADMF